jgi:hypothetical protein
VSGLLTKLPLLNGTCSLDALEVATSRVLTSARRCMAASGSPGGGEGVVGGPA